MKIGIRSNLFQKYSLSNVFRINSTMTDVLNLLLLKHEFNLIFKPIVCYGFVLKIAKGPVIRRI